MQMPMTVILVLYILLESDLRSTPTLLQQRVLQLRPIPGVLFSFFA